jgi:hypothetical protein
MEKMEKVFYMEKGDGRKCRKCMRTDGIYFTTQSNNSQAYSNVGFIS